MRLLRLVRHVTNQEINSRFKEKRRLRWKQAKRNINTHKHSDLAIKRRLENMWRNCFGRRGVEDTKMNWKHTIVKLEQGIEQRRSLVSAGMYGEKNFQTYVDSGKRLRRSLGTLY